MSESAPKPATPKGPWTGLRGGHRVRKSRAWETNCGLLTDGRHAVLVDAGVLADEIAEMLAAIPAGAQTMAVFTHHHWDHVLAQPSLGGTRTLAHGRFAALLAADLAHAREEAAKIAAEHGQPFARTLEAFAPETTVQGGETVAFGPWTLEFAHAPGHSADSIAMLVREAGVLFVGDLLSDIEPPSLDEPPAVYRETLARLRPFAESNAAEVLVPGHGSLARGQRAILARFDADLAYLDALEAGVAESVAAGHSADETVKALESMRYPGGGGKPYSTADWHRANVRLVWETSPRG